MHELGAWPRRGQTPAAQVGGSRGLARWRCRAGLGGPGGNRFPLGPQFFYDGKLHIKWAILAVLMPQRHEVGPHGCAVVTPSSPGLSLFPNGTPVPIQPLPTPPTLAPWDSVLAPVPTASLVTGRPTRGRPWTCSPGLSWWVRDHNFWAERPSTAFADVTG